MPPYIITNKNEHSYKETRFCYKNVFPQLVSTKSSHTTGKYHSMIMILINRPDYCSMPYYCDFTELSKLMEKQ